MKECEINLKLRNKHSRYFQNLKIKNYTQLCIVFYFWLSKYVKIYLLKSNKFMVHVRTKRKKQVTLKSIGGVIFSVIVVFIVAAILVNLGDVARGITSRNVIKNSLTKRSNLLAAIEKSGNIQTSSAQDVQSQTDDSPTWILNSDQTLLTPNQNVIFVKTAATDLEREMGLSGREKLKFYQSGNKITTEGMLFVFPKETTTSFWMKDMNFDLDMIWLNKDMKIVSIAKNVKANSYNAEDPNSSKLYTNGKTLARYVLEIDAGLTDKLGLAIGDKLSVQ